MRITIESTTSIVDIEVDGARVPARIWEGTTESGVKVVAFITRITPQSHDPEVNAIFARELQECRQPTIEPFSRGIDLRLII